MKNKTKDKLFNVFCLLPALVGLAIFIYYPITQLIKISLTDWNLLSDTYNYVGLENYQWVVSGSGSKYIWNSFAITIFYALCEMLITVCLGLIFAVVLRGSSRYLKVARFVIFMPRYISLSCASIIFLWILNTDNGVLNQLLDVVNIDRVDWLGGKITALVSIIAVSAWRNIGFGMVLYLSAIESIPKIYYEASSLDGATPIQSFFSITMPNLLPTIGFLSITSFIAAMKAFQNVEIMTEGGPMRSTELIVYLIYRYAMVDFRMNRAATVSVMLFAFLFFVTIIFVVLSKLIHRMAFIR